jgi:hypothetical protein
LGGNIRSKLENEMNANLFCVNHGFTTAHTLQAKEIVVSGPNGAACFDDPSIILENIGVGSLPEIARVEHYNTKVLNVISLIERN